MRRRQILEHMERAREAREIGERVLKEQEESKMRNKVPNSNLVSNSSPPGDIEKAKMFLPLESEIVKPNGTPFRKRGSKPGARTAEYKTLQRKGY